MTPLRVGLLWHSVNSGNLGVGALTVANVAIVREAARRAGREVELVVIGFDDREPLYPQVADVRTWSIDGRTLVSPKGYLRIARECDVVVDIGGGDSFSDIYGMKRLGYMLATKLAVIGGRRPLVLAPQTLGPFVSRPARALGELCVAGSRATFSRDEVSLGWLTTARARAKVRTTTDVAFALPYEPQEPPADRVRVGFNISALLHNGGYSGANQFGLRMDYRRFVDGVLEAFGGRDDVEVVLLPHVVFSEPSVEDDLALSRALAQRAGLAEPPRFADPVAAKSFISGCHFVVGSRMHACIAAVASGRATVPVAYSRKFAGVFDPIGYGHTVDARALDADEAVAAVASAFERRGQLAGDAVRATRVARERLSVYTDSLADILRAL